MSPNVKRFLLLFLLSQWSFADTEFELNSEVTDQGRLRLSGKARSGMYLGLSLYSPKGRARHQLYPLSASKFNRRISIWSQFRGGSYQVAIWKNRIYAGDCRAQTCLYCPKYGYHLEGLASSSSGSL